MILLILLRGVRVTGRLLTLPVNQDYHNISISKKHRNKLSNKKKKSFKSRTRAATGLASYPASIKNSCSQEKQSMLEASREACGNLKSVRLLFLGFHCQKCDQSCRKTQKPEDKAISMSTTRTLKVQLCTAVALEIISILPHKPS